MNVSYTEDITVCGVLIADKIQSLYDSVMDKNEITECDLDKFPNLQLKVQ